MLYSRVLIDYEYKMCLYGQPRHLVKYQITKVPEGYDYRYNNGSLEPLWTDEYPDIDLPTLEQLLRAFVGLIEDLHEFLLDFDHVSLKGEECFVCDEGLVRFTYRPFISSDSVPHRQRIEAWLAMIYGHVDLNSEEAMRLLHPLGVAIASKDFDLDTFSLGIKGALGMAYD